ncbi:MAG: hypothetical protein AABX16_04805 [Nanoarchaeota archaeon]
MVNWIVYNYLKQYLSNYKREDLKQKILAGGYSEKDFWDALQQIEAESAPHTLTAKNEPVLSTPKKSSIFFKIAGMCGIFALIFFITGGFLSSPVTDILYIGSFFFLIIFYSGFISLGKKYDRTFIRVISIFFILFYIGIMVFPLMNIFVPDVIKPMYDFIVMAANTSPSTYSIFLTTANKNILWGIIAIASLFLLLHILFGAGLVSLRQNIALANLAGILTIVGWLTLFLIVGLLIIPVAFILQIIILLKE